MAPQPTVDLGEPVTAWKVNDALTVWWGGLVRTAGADEELREYLASECVGIELPRTPADDVTQPPQMVTRRIQSQEDLNGAMSEELFGPIWTFDRIDGFRPPVPAVEILRDAEGRIISPDKREDQDLALRLEWAFQAFHDDDPTWLKALGVIPQTWDQEVDGQPPDGKRVP